MRPDDGYDFVSFEETLSQLAAEEVGTPSHIIVLYQIVTEAILVINGVRPHQVAEQSGLGDFAETVDLLDVI